MKLFLKRYLKFIIGVAALLVVLFMFGQTRATTSLEVGQLKDWGSATVERKITAVKVLTAQEKDLDLLVKCIDKMATLPDSANLPVRDATELCFMGVKLKDNM